MSLRKCLGVSEMSGELGVGARAARRRFSCRRGLVNGATSPPRCTRPVVAGRACPKARGMAIWPRFIVVLDASAHTGCCARSPLDLYDCIPVFTHILTTFTSLLLSFFPLCSLHPREVPHLRTEKAGGWKAMEEAVIFSISL